jgi:nicotinate-nucleotide pyrophosphorylase (carboxylating)
VRVDPPPREAVEDSVRRALAEDRALEDATTLAVVPPGLAGRGVFISREEGVLAGMPVVAEVFRQLDPAVVLSVTVEEGARFGPNAVLAEVRGPASPLLQGERVSLNFLQRLSGTATAASSYVVEVLGTRAVILDTRKTTPGLRDLEKYAVRCGGATNHRRDLAVMAMIKDNHREALARDGKSLTDGVEAIRARTPGVPVEVEIDSLDDLEAALAAKPEWVLLDNMPPAEMAEAVRRTAGRAKLEASGGVRLGTVRAIAETGVDAISVGALTHSAPALDISLDLRF